MCWKAALSSARDPWPPPLRERIPVHATVPAVSAEVASQIVRSSGCASAKVKVGEGDDEERLEAVRDALGPSGHITADANGAWSVDQAFAKSKMMSRHGVDLLEQPVATIEEMKVLRPRIDIAMAADEVIRSAEDLMDVATRQAADAAVVKVQHLGGVSRALRAVERARLPAIVSCLIETSVGVSAGLALAAALPELPYPCGLGTLPLLTGDLVNEPLLPFQGHIEVRRPQVDMAALLKFEAEVALPAGAS